MQKRPPSNAQSNSSATLAPISTVATVHGELARGPNEPGQLHCQLVVLEGPDMGRGVALPWGDGADARELIVGTDASCDLVLSDERVSRQHLALRVDASGQGYHARDLDSRNGTLYAGSTIGTALLPAGATLKLGRSYLRIQPEPEVLEVTPSQSRRCHELHGESLALREVFAVLELAAASEVTVLLEGETGTGKELAARAIHELGERRKGPFVALDCGALPESLLESELFGHVRGAFTGATGDRAGAFLRARGGTIFLDELDSVPLSVQARLLRVVEERRVRPVGADAERDVDARLIAATRRDLRPLVADGAFRPDLFYRLSVLRVVLPPLRERREDIAPIVAALLTARGFSLPDGAKTIAGANLDKLLAHDWLGNVRELRNVIDRAVALTPGAESFGALRISLSPQRGSDEALSVRSDLTFAEAKKLVLDTFELRYLRDVLERVGGNVSAAAREANVDRKHLRTLLRRHGLLPSDTEADADAG